MKRILIMENDRDVSDRICAQLGRDGYEVNAVADGTNGLEKLNAVPPDLLILDLALPEGSGLEILKEVRNNPFFNRLPILLLSEPCSEDERVSKFEAGADDLVVKPFSARELLARVRALLWRACAPSGSGNVLKFGRLVIDRDFNQVSLSGRAVPLSVLEFRLLCHFACHPSRIFTRYQLLDSVWGSGDLISPRSVDASVKRLREKVERNPASPQFLRTVYGVGYVFEPSVR